MSAQAITILVSIISYLVMLVAYYLHARRTLHVGLMVTVMLYDLLIPIYLYLARDWYKRLIEHGDILTFGVWIHFGCILTLYVLYGFQISAGLRLWRGDREALEDHQGQGKAILVVRAMVIITGWLLAEPEKSYSP